MNLVEAFLEGVEQRRLATSSTLSARSRGRLGQFFTPRATAQLLAQMPADPQQPWMLLDPGAGVGSLTAALVARWLTQTDQPTLSAVAYEVDAGLVPALQTTLREAQSLAHAYGRTLETEIRTADFVLNPPPTGCCNVVLMNPPYRKLGVSSAERLSLAAGAGEPVRVTNLYAAFLVRAIRALRPAGSLVAITPRSFANGPYFRDLREELLARAGFERLHVFESRNRVFAEAAVLQENLVFSMSVGVRRPSVLVSSSRDDRSPIEFSTRHCDDIVHPGDPHRFVRLPLDNSALAVAGTMACLPASLSDLGLQVSTGRVVDFRARDQLRARMSPDSVPLVYAQNLRHGAIDWPRAGRKPQALTMHSTTEHLMLPNENYVLVKRFTSKEERRRVVAAVSHPEAYDGASLVAFENHLNVFHAAGRGLDHELAAGLAHYLNTRAVDDYVRQFSGHTQINATDLRGLRYPAAAELRRLGRLRPTRGPSHTQLVLAVDESRPSLGLAV